MTKVGFVSLLGCPKNSWTRGDDVFLRAEGYELTPRAAEAEFWSSTRCSSSKRAEESVDAILEMAEHKNSAAAKN